MRNVILSVVFACSVFDLSAQQMAGSPPMATGPGELPVIVYKTKKNYRNLVPVILSPDKSTIINYPDPKDFAKGKSPWSPVALHRGYWLDRKGITADAAFLSLTYDQYAKLKAIPSVAELYAMIKDKEPFVQFCVAGRRKDFSANPRKQLNALIDKRKKFCK